MAEPRDVAEKLMALAACRRCNCLDCTREGCGEGHDHVCTHGARCIETPERWRAYRRRVALVCREAAAALRPPGLDRDGERMREAQAPDGFVLVPAVETMDMLAAGQKAWLADPCKLSSTLYRAMVAAAPSLAHEEKAGC